MPKHLIGIAPSDDLTPNTRTALAAAGFREAGQLEYTEAVWVAEGREPRTVLRRTVYRYDAPGDERAEADAREIVGPDFDVRVVSHRGPAA